MGETADASGHPRLGFDLAPAEAGESLKSRGSHPPWPTDHDFTVLREPRYPLSNGSGITSTEARALRRAYAEFPRIGLPRYRPNPAAGSPDSAGASPAAAV